MTHRIFYLLSVLALYSMPSLASSIAPHSAIQMSIIAEDGRSYPVYAVNGSHRSNTHRAYLEAKYGENYAIRIYNNSNRRVGLVIAVDGRNVISGQKSNLSHKERMYILDPWQTASYDGWRTSNRKINQFFFTEAENSYAGAWQDHSAMGVIAVAAFNEKKRYRPLLEKSAPRAKERRLGSAEMDSSADVMEESGKAMEPKKQAGTGFGEEKYSYARVVTFKPETHAMEKFFYKYEWRQTLCQQRVIDCTPHTPNRFWPEHDEYYGYAPYPPR